MAKKRRDRQKTDASRIGKTGAGKLDRDPDRDAGRTAPPAGARAETRRPTLAEQRARLEHERDIAIEQLRQLGISGALDSDAPRAEHDTWLEEGDAAQASERNDMAFARRERLGARINELTAALGRLANGTYGTCEACGQPIEPERLSAMPEARTCIACQARIERPGGTTAAA